MWRTVHPPSFEAWVDACRRERDAGRPWAGVWISPHPGESDATARRVLTALEGRAVRLAKDARGKPFADGTLAFSLAHTRTHLFVAVCDAAVGVDAERADRRLRDPEALASWLGCPDRGLDLLSRVSCYEARFKCMGDLPLSALRTTNQPPAAWTLHGSEDQHVVALSRRGGLPDVILLASMPHGGCEPGG